MSRAPSPQGRHAPCEDRIPQLHRVVLHARELDSLLTGVPSAIDHHLDAVELAELERERRSGREPEPLEGARPLHGEERVLIGDVAHIRAAQLALHEPGEVRFAVRRVDDDQVAMVVEAIDDHVVDDPARIVRDQRVLRPARLQLVDVVRERRLQQIACGRSFDLELAHVRDVEDARIGAHRPVLLDHALILDRHLPTGEGDHARAEGNVTVVQRRSPERLHPRAMLTVSEAAGIRVPPHRSS